MVFQPKNTPFTHKFKTCFIVHPTQLWKQQCCKSIRKQKIHLSWCQAQWDLQFCLSLLDHFQKQLMVMLNYKQNIMSKKNLNKNPKTTTKKQICKWYNTTLLCLQGNRAFTHQEERSECTACMSWVSLFLHWDSLEDWQQEGETSFKCFYDQKAWFLCGTHI